jgi:hypothetical protein
MRLVLEAGAAEGPQLASVSPAGGEASIVPESPLWSRRLGPGCWCPRGRQHDDHALAGVDEGQGADGLPAPT